MERGLDRQCHSLGHAHLERRRQSRRHRRLQRIGHRLVLRLWLHRGHGRAGRRQSHQRLPRRPRRHQRRHGGGILRRGRGHERRRQFLGRPRRLQQQFDFRRLLYRHGDQCQRRCRCQRARRLQHRHDQPHLGERRGHRRCHQQGRAGRPDGRRRHYQFLLGYRHHRTKHERRRRHRHRWYDRHQPLSQRLLRRLRLRRHLVRDRRLNAAVPAHGRVLLRHRQCAPAATDSAQSRRLLYPVPESEQRART